MRSEKITLDTKASVATGTPEEVGRFVNGAVQIGGTFVGTVQLEGTINGNNWFVIGSPATGAALIAMPSHAVDQIRMNTTAYTSGTPTATFMAFDSRTDVQ